MTGPIPITRQCASWFTGWFESHGFDPPDARKAGRGFHEWLGEGSRARRENAAYYELAARTVHRHVSVTSHYWSDSNWLKLSGSLRAKLDSITRDLARIPPVRPGGAVGIRGTRRIALLAELSDAPSPRFHLEAIRRIAESAERAEFSVSIHDVPKQTPLHSTIWRIASFARPNAVVLLRITPCDESLEVLYGKSIP